MKALALALIAAFALFLLLNRDGGEVRIETGGVDALVQTRDLDVRFSQHEIVSAALMVFGGADTRRMPNSFSDYSLAALPLSDAVAIARRYPDFHLCKSPGAVEAQQKVRQVALIAGSQDAGATLAQSIALHEKRLRQGAERTCVALSGRRVVPTSVTIRDDGRDLSGQILGRLDGIEHLVVDRAEIVDCRQQLLAAGS